MARAPPPAQGERRISHKEGVVNQSMGGIGVAADPLPDPWRSFMMKGAVDLGRLSGLATRAFCVPERGESHKSGSVEAG